MTLPVLAFVFGAFYLQQMSVLPRLLWAATLIPLLLINITFAYAKCNVNQHLLTLLKHLVLN